MKGFEKADSKGILFSWRREENVIVSFSLLIDLVQKEQKLSPFLLSSRSHQTMIARDEWKVPFGTGLETLQLREKTSSIHSFIHPFVT